MSRLPAMSLDGIVAFTHTVELGSFSAASAVLGLSKSAAAKSVARLEERLGVQLLMRTTRSLTLTQEGEIFFQKCRAILEDVDAVEALMSARKRDVSGSLKVSLPLSFGRLWAASALAAMAAGHPALILNLSFTDRYVDLIDEGFDLAVRIGSSRDSTTVMTRKLVDQHAILCASPDYVERHGSPDDIEDMNAHRCILFEQGGRLLPWRLKNRQGNIVEHAGEPHMVISHGEAILDAVIAGHGIARLPTWLAGVHLKSGELVSVMPSADLVDRTINVLWPRRREHTPKIRLAIDTLVERFSANAPWD